MVKDYDSFKVGLGDLLATLPERNQYFFGCWCVHALYGHYVDNIPKRVNEADQGVIRNANEFLWTTYHEFPLYDGNRLVEIFEAVSIIGEKRFNHRHYSEYAAQTLVVGQQLALAFLEEKEMGLIVEVAEVLLQNMEHSIGSVIGHSTVDLFNHPLIKHELLLQGQLLDRLAAGPDLTSSEKSILRPQFVNI